MAMHERTSSEPDNLWTIIFSGEDYPSKRCSISEAQPELITYKSFSYKYSSRINEDIWQQISEAAKEGIKQLKKALIENIYEKEKMGLEINNNPQIMIELQRLVLKIKKEREASD